MASPPGQRTHAGAGPARKAPPAHFPTGPPLLRQLGRSALKGDWARLLEYPGFLLQLAYQRSTNRRFQAILPLAGPTQAPVEEGPLISILMPTFETDLSMLQHAVESVRAQPYGRWELLIGDDGSTSAPLQALFDQLQAADARIRVVRGDHEGIVGATNRALQSAGGHWVAFMDHDDALAPGALGRVAQVLASEANADLLFTDECRIGPKGDLIEPAFKPCWSPETLLGINFVCHWLVVRRDLLTQIGGLRAGTDGSQDHDLLLRLAQRAQTVVHVREPLYHWRITRGSVGTLGQTHENGVKAVANILETGRVAAQVLGGPFPCTYRIRPARPPRFSLLVVEPEGRSLAPHLFQVFEKGHGTFGAHDVLFVGSAAAVESARHLPWTVEEAPSRNLLDCIAAGIARASCERVVILSRGSIPVTPDAMSNLAGGLADSRVALVAPKLLRGTHKIEAAGLALDPSRGLVPRFAGHSRRTRLGGGAAQLLRDVLASTFDCAATTKTVWSAVGRSPRAAPAPLDEVDWCLRAVSKGLRIVYNPEAEVEAPRFPAAALARPPALGAAMASAGLPADDPYFGRGLAMRRALGREWTVLSVEGWKAAPRVMVWRDGVPTPQAL